MIVQTLCSRQFSRSTLLLPAFSHHQTDSVTRCLGRFWLQGSNKFMLAASQKTRVGLKFRNAKRLQGVIKMNHFTLFLECFLNLCQHSMFFVKMNPDSHYLLWPEKKTHHVLPSFKVMVSATGTTNLGIEMLLAPTNQGTVGCWEQKTPLRELKETR